MKPLTSTKLREYPPDFLVARLKGKRARLKMDWATIQNAHDPAKHLNGNPVDHWLEKSGNDGLWQFLLLEYLWIYQRMNNAFRKIFMPYFFFVEGQFLLVCLRNRFQGSLSNEIREMTVPLLDQELVNILTEPASLDLLLEEMEKYFLTISPVFKGFLLAYQEHGFQALEQVFSEKIFAYLTSQKLHHLLKVFFARLIDMRNFLILYKALRWQVEHSPSFLPGGVISPAHFTDSFKKNDFEKIRKLAGLQPAMEREKKGVLLESDLIDRLTAALKTNIYEPSGIAFILYYLWEQYCWRRSTSIILHTSSFG